MVAKLGRKGSRHTGGCGECRKCDPAKKPKSVVGDADLCQDIWSSDDDALQSCGQRAKESRDTHVVGHSPTICDHNFAEADS